MLIDWFTVAAQILNFLILVFLLKHFLYDRIIGAMDERERKIRGRLEDAEEKKREREEEAETYRRKNRELEDKRKEILDAARDEAEEKRKELVRQARENVESLRTQWRESLQREQESFLGELKELAGQQFLDISRRALRDLADSDVEDRVVRVFLDRVEDLGGEDRKKLAEALKGDGSSATVRSAFELSPAQRGKITKALHEQVSENLEMEYETVPEMLPGIEIKGGGRKLAWNLGEYLKGLEERTRNILEQGAEKKGKDEKAKEDEGAGG